MKNLADFDTIVFDLGGVIINLDRDNAVRHLRNLGLHNADTYLDLFCQSGPFLDLETGKITAAEFFDKIRLEIGNNTPDILIQDAFNKFLVDIPLQRLDTLTLLRKKGFRILALSNTNPVMYNSWINKQFKSQGLTINDYFDGIVTSFQEGCCKPDPHIFHILIKRYNLDPDKTLYLDDSPNNCSAAEKCGLNTILISKDNPMTILNQAL